MSVAISPVLLSVLGLIGPFPKNPIFSPEFNGIRIESIDSHPNANIGSTIVVIVCLCLRSTMKPIDCCAREVLFELETELKRHFMITY